MFRDEKNSEISFSPYVMTTSTRYYFRFFLQNNNTVMTYEIYFIFSILCFKPRYTRETRYKHKLFDNNFVLTMYYLTIYFRKNS